MNTELSSIMSQDGRLVEWANKVTYNLDLTSEDKDISSVMDNWAREVGRTGFDEKHEISQLIAKAVTLEAVSAPSDLIDRIFNNSNIGEFDDIHGEVAPKNTIKVYDAVNGGNVDRSFVDHSVVKPTWINLQAETDISLQQMRRGGYKTVANLVNYIREALEYKKIAKLIDIIDTAITGGDALVNEAGAAPTDESMKKLALYLHDVTDGDTPVVFGLNKYIQAVAGLTGVTTFLTDREKGLWNTTGFVKEYAGCELMGLSGQKKLGDGSLVLPDRRLFGVAGKIGDCVTRGESIVLQDTDINSEKIHIKVGGYTFGTMIYDLEKVAKMVMAQ